MVSGSTHRLGKAWNRRCPVVWTRLFWLAVVLGGWLLAGSFQPALAAAGDEPPTYLIGPGDTLDIVVWRQGELSTSVTVRPDGRISMPLVDDLVAAGKKPMDLADEIEAQLAEYLQDPLVTVTVIAGLGDPRQQVRILGEAGKPSTLPYRSGMTALDAVIASGGLSRQADGNGAVILRQTPGDPGGAPGGDPERIPLRLADLVRDGDSSANVALLPGDVIIIPEGFLDGAWRVSSGVSGSETFSDNIDQGPSGEREAGLISRAGPTLSISGETARVSMGFNGNLSGVHQIGGNDEGFSIDPSIAGTSTTEVLKDVLFFDLDASISRQLLDSRDSSSASGASTSNRDVVAALTASPYLVHRLGDFADAQWRYSFSPVLIDSGNSSDGTGDAQDVYSHEGSLTVSSGQDFSFFNWTWTNSVTEEVRSGGSDIESASTDFDVTYPLWQGFSLIGALGFEHRDGDGDDDGNFDGLTWRGGFAWNPNPDLSLEATFGRRDDDENLDASLNYQVGPRTSINASYSEALETSQQRAISNLSRLTVDPDTDELIDGDTQQGFAGDNDPFSFNNGTTRTRTLRFGADHTSGRNTFALTGSAGTSRGESEDDEDFYDASLSWSRSLRQGLNMSSSASYERSEFQEDDRTDDTYSFDMGLSYRLSTSASASLRYSFQAQDSTDSDESFYENAVTLGLSFSF
ncbi:MAG: XrtA/PEP-CTERM system exopolysaccharide export protein [Kiloniellaceae bacterium]